MTDITESQKWKPRCRRGHSARDLEPRMTIHRAGQTTYEMTSMGKSLDDISSPLPPEQVQNEAAPRSGLASQKTLHESPAFQHLFRQNKPDEAGVLTRPELSDETSPIDRVVDFVSWFTIRKSSRPKKPDLWSGHRHKKAWPPRPPPPPGGRRSILPFCGED